MVVTDQADVIYAGNARVLAFTITDEDTTGSPAKDLTGLTFEWLLALQNEQGSPITSNPLVEKSTASGITVISAVGGTLEVELLAADTDLLSPRTYYWELEAFDGAGGNVVLATGTLEVRPNVDA